MSPTSAPDDTGADETDPTEPAAADPDEDTDASANSAGDADTDFDAAFVESLEGYIYFSSERGDIEGELRDDLYVMDADGSDVRRLTETPLNEWWPEMHPDGGALLYGRTYPEDDNRAPRSGHSAWGVFYWGAGVEPVDITDNNQFQSGTTWSPDGSKLLFSSGRGERAGFNDEGLYEMGGTNLWVMDADGSNYLQLTEDGAGSGTWSPDGSRIVFTQSLEGTEGRKLFVMNADGSGVELLADGPGHYARPHWSPDGERIVFDNDRDGDCEIFVINADGSGETQLTDNDAGDDFARWSPNSGAIVFTSDRDGNNEIYVMAADGASQSNLSQDPAFDALPSWSVHPWE
ncbi:MAG: hypothetical protein U5Q44_03750 [Dehalococcoidia bacterium]|nr:hypothetical protein [Dehalococcoidia bacterium]